MPTFRHYTTDYNPITTCADYLLQRVRVVPDRKRISHRQRPMQEKCVRLSSWEGATRRDDRAGFLREVEESNLGKSGTTDTGNGSIERNIGNIRCNVGVAHSLAKRCRATATNGSFNAYDT
jgi:hypothetical protein